VGTMQQDHSAKMAETAERISSVNGSSDKVVHSASLPTIPAFTPVRIPLTQLTRGQRARIVEPATENEDSSMLRAMGLRPDASVEMCRLGEPCIVSLSGACGGGCRIGLAKDIASRVMVEIHN
jgi:Fe2+ transport system protein FeoA